MLNLLVIGDLIVDETWPVEVVRLNPEVPAPTAEILAHTPIKTPGGAGFAAAWAAKHGINTHLLTASSPQNAEILEKHKVHVHSPWGVANGHNVKKTRYIEKNSGYHLLRLDNDRLVPPPATDPYGVIAEASIIQEQCGRIDVCLLSDYAKGFFHGKVSWTPLLSWLEENHITTLLDTRAKDIRLWVRPNSFRHWLKLNDREFSNAVKSLDLSSTDPWQLVRSGVFGSLLLTHGPNGADVYMEEGVFSAKPKLEYDTITDPTGCGDIFDVSFLSALGDGNSIQVALQYAVDTATRFAYVRLGDKLNG